MTIGNAKQFIQRGMLDSELRARVLASSKGMPLKAILVEDDRIEIAFHEEAL